MLVNSLLFTIVLIFVYETFQKLFKLHEEYFTESFVSLANPDLSNASELNDIAKTIAINCKEYPTQKNTIQTYASINPITLDTVDYARFNPLKYDSAKKYYFRRDILIPEGIRRSLDDDKEIEKIQKLYDEETDTAKREILQDELDLFNWRKYILVSTDPKTKEPRSMRDITSDYFPQEIGMVRTWREPHSHIPDYSNKLNYGYQIQGYENHQPNKINSNKHIKQTPKPCNAEQISSSCIQPSLGTIYRNYEDYSKTGTIL
jgi:hypothetical protein